MNCFLVTGGAGFIGSNLALALQQHFESARIVVVDDFRSGDFKNLCGFRGDFVAADISRLDWNEQFKDITFDVIFHEASITDTTDHDQFKQAHDNIEGFRRLLSFAEQSQTPVIYASSAATYGLKSGIMYEDDPVLAPANIYAFTKVQIDNLARYYMNKMPSWKIIGLRYFNVYGPREAHKRSAASMVYQLYKQIKDGKNPRIFKFGEQKRDFVYVKDVINLNIKAISAKKSGIYNCGSGCPISFNQLVEILNKNLGTDFAPEYFENPYKEFYQSHTEADLTKTKNDFGFSPTTPFEGIADYIAILEGKKPLPYF